MFNRVLAIYILVLGIIIIVMAFAIYQDIRYKSGELTILERYEQNSTAQHKNEL
ncbi:hypothetical protein J7E79_14155 [Bacillus sp. ISL-40]|uniref:hypothetical protein n=1 Tax=unclassified Bacillus (in: firmicutes) TaxID=185979 RepID=UPI001BEB61AE|nr:MULTISPECIES: hypothetical protein [unclassified Bacillus (in: firmicutes)]MBT2698554.1 hypothetical protein [Bacillus sp. ISL-40]MBT2720187.1 hypothetical protein [Bacillus sp. ISL-46]MBT2739220.1 hypothetical protein [Bacillus sp. ISL-77]